MNALKRENPRQYISLFREDKESQENRKRKKVKKSKTNGIMGQLSSTVTDEVGCKDNSKYILNEITGNSHPATDIEKAMCCKCKQTKRVDIGIQVTTTNVSVTPKNSKAGTATNGDVTPYTEHDMHTNDNVTAENSSGSVPCEIDMPTSNGATPENGSCENSSNVTCESTHGEKEVIDGNTNITDSLKCKDNETARDLFKKNCKTELLDDTMMTNLVDKLHAYDCLQDFVNLVKLLANGIVTSDNSILAMP